MNKTIDINENIALTFFPQSVEDEITQNIYCIIKTMQGTVPMYRQFGIDSDYLHRPAPVAKSAYAVAIADAVEKFEPRAHVVRVLFDDEKPETPWILHPRIEVSFDAGGQ